MKIVAGLKHEVLPRALCLWLIVLSSATVHAVTPSQIDAVVYDEMAARNIVGLAVGIVADGRLYYAKGYGHQDLQAAKPVTKHTVFRWASVSKVLTAAAVLKLAEDSPRFSLSDHVTKYVDYWPGTGNRGDIRIWQLLSHRAGIIHYRTRNNCPNNPLPDYRLGRYKSKYYNARQSVGIFSDQSLCFDPGTGFKYSTFGYSLLGAAIEGASGQDYASWINENIRDQLGMLSLQQSTAARSGFDKVDGQLLEIVDGNVAWRLPGGGWESDIIDLAKFANALIQGTLLPDTGLMWVTVPGNHHYGLGMMHNADNSVVWHEGGHVNSRALLTLFPASTNRLGIVVLTNSAHSEPDDIAYRLARLFY